VAAHRVVFDCMLSLQAAARATGPAAACLKIAEEGLVELCLSEDVLAEIRDVLTRPKLQAKFPALTAVGVAEFVDRLIRKSVLVPVVAALVALPRDPKDEKYLNLALAANARFLVSRDNDLLDLNRDDNSLGRLLKQQYPNLVVTDPVSFLRTVEFPTASDPKRSEHGNPQSPSE